jgi:hypothetical protein
MQLSSDWAAAHTLHSCTRGLQGLAIPHILWPPYIFHYSVLYAPEKFEGATLNICNKKLGGTAERRETLG